MNETKNRPIITNRSIQSPSLAARAGRVALAFLLVAPVAAAQSRIDERMEVTATRIPALVELVPAAITIIDVDDLVARGVRDLPGALALAGGLSASAGGDGGPLSSVVEIWGLREFDAFLLVIDGVPRGGAFNPTLDTVELTGVDRIEILRGAAPVTYGATSFIGVIHVIHRDPETGRVATEAQVSGGGFGSGSISFVGDLPSSSDVSHLLLGSVDRVGLVDERAGGDRAHLLYRQKRPAGDGALTFDLDATFLRQTPASPHPRQGRSLTTLVPLDANHNPSDARLDEDRLQLVVGHSMPIQSAMWRSTLSFARSEREVVRGFIESFSAETAGAQGYTQDQSIDDLYFESHVEIELVPGLRMASGVDLLYGQARIESDLFAYQVGRDGSGAPSSSTLPVLGTTEWIDTRTFAGGYVQAEWQAHPRVLVDAGLRLNVTEERRRDDEGNGERRSDTRPSGSVGATLLAWSGRESRVHVFVDYRDTFKPAALDFGPDPAESILEPEIGRSYEAGVRGSALAGRLSGMLTVFRLDLENLVLSQAIDGLPQLVNGGSQRFDGIELEGEVRILDATTLRGSYGWHDPRYVDYLREFDGVPTQLAGKRPEMSPRNLAALGLVHSPSSGFQASVVANYLGSRYLNKRNTALAPAFTAWSAGVGYRIAEWLVRLDGYNLGNARDPVAESEIGDAQYYRMPARTWALTVGTRRSR